MLSFFHHLLLWLLIVLRIVYVCQDSIYSLCLFLWSFCDTNCKPSLCFDELCLHTSLVQPIVVLRIRKLIDDGLERYATQGITLWFTRFTRSIVCTTQCKMCHRNEAKRERASAALQEKYTWYNHYTRLLQRKHKQHSKWFSRLVLRTLPSFRRLKKHKRKRPFDQAPHLCNQSKVQGFIRGSQGYSWTRNNVKV